MKQDFDRYSSLAKNFSFSSNAQKPLYYLDEAPVKMVEIRRQGDGFMFVLLL